MNRLIHALIGSPALLLLGIAAAHADVPWSIALPAPDVHTETPPTATVYEVFSTMVGPAGAIFVIGPMQEADCRRTLVRIGKSLAERLPPTQPLASAKCAYASQLTILASMQTAGYCEIADSYEAQKLHGVPVMLWLYACSETPPI